MTTVGKIARSATRTRLKNRSRDAAFIQKFEAFARKGRLGPTLETAVKRDRDQRISGARTRALFRYLRMIAAGYKGPKPSTKPFPRLSDVVNPTTRVHRIGAPWTDTHDFLKAYFAHWALALDCEVRAFTLNLGGEVEKQALAKGPDASRWLSQLLNRSLKSSVDRPVSYWFRIELGDGESPYLHLHGELACSDAELEAVRKALRNAGGSWLPKNMQVDTRRKNPDTAWVSYVMEPDIIQLQQAYLTRASHKPHTPSWRDSRFFIGQELSRAAKALYESLRSSIRIETKPIPRRR